MKGKRLITNASLPPSNPHSVPSAGPSTSNISSLVMSPQAFAETRMKVYASGTLASIYCRASEGCPFCADIVVPEAQNILVDKDPRTTENGSTLPANSLSVRLEVSDIAFSRDARELHRSGGIYISVRRCRQHEAFKGHPSIANEWNKPHKSMFLTLSTKANRRA